ncbi:MAG: DUF1554 domain-containing protein [Leptospiraceae bacterium]|nr:DUF1554 domain-containing protein [Leptospiraceae bacterium]MCK6380543.1 DUF1554 domain-containing protein [Leptospiraceae bacterium]NUM41772.1 DUF1554 domain-containing protein [Leptospiraceae bacterium]
MKFFKILSWFVFFFHFACRLEPETMRKVELEDLLFPEGILGNPAVPIQYSILVSSPVLGYTLKNGGTDTVTVKLSSQPTETVTMPVSVSNISQVSVSTSSLSFTPINWNSPQIVTVAGLEDFNYGVAENFTINIGPTISADPNYNGLSMNSIIMSNRDFRKLIFQTGDLGLGGNFGGISGADSICNSYVSKPANTGTYKAMIVLTGVRIASVTANAGDGQIDWVLRPNQFYTRPDGTPITTTNSVGLHDFASNLTNSFGTNATAVRMGLNNTNDWTGGGGCLNWTSNNGGDWGAFAFPQTTNSQALFGGNLSCTPTNPSSLLCVQQ